MLALGRDALLAASKMAEPVSQPFSQEISQDLSALSSSQAQELDASSFFDEGPDGGGDSQSQDYKFFDFAGEASQGSTSHDAEFDFHMSQDSSAQQGFGDEWQVGASEEQRQQYRKGNGDDSSVAGTVELDFKETFDDDEDEVKELPAHACAYCGIHNPGSVVRCIKSAKWFCNSSSDSPNVPHTVQPHESRAYAT